MAFQKSCGIIVFRRDRISVHYLLINSSKEKANWGFPKGHIEEGENEIETARRETKEETGLSKLTFIPEFKKSTTYFFYDNKKKVMKKAIYFLAETTEENITLSPEHIAYCWATFERALAVVPYPDLIKILKKADDFLKQAKQETLSSFEKKSF